MDVRDRNDTAESIANRLFVFDRRFVQYAKHSGQETIQLSL